MIHEQIVIGAFNFFPVGYTRMQLDEMILFDCFTITILEFRHGKSSTVKSNEYENQVRE